VQKKILPHPQQARFPLAAKQSGKRVFFSGGYPI
jgi:hypothetical protein